MKTTYRRDNQFVFRRPGQHKALLIGLPVVLAVVIFFFGDILIRGLDAPALKLAYPILKVEQVVSDNTDDLTDFFHSKSSLVAINKSLAEENIRLKNQLVNYRTLEIENDSLKEELLLPASGQLLVSGYVVGRPDFLPYDFLLIKIDRGARDKIKVGDLVVAERSVFLGKIVEISGSLVKVELASSPDKKTTVVIGRSGIVADSIGVGGGNFAVTLPRGLTVNVGDPVVNDRYPGYLLGIVGEVINTPADPFQSVQFRLPVNINDLKIVEFHAG